MSGYRLHVLRTDYSYRDQCSACFLLAFRLKRTCRCWVGVGGWSPRCVSVSYSIAVHWPCMMQSHLDYETRGRRSMSPFRFGIRLYNSGVLTCTDYVRMYISSEEIFSCVSRKCLRNSNLNEFRIMQYDTANTYLWFYVPDAINLVLNKINNTSSVPPS